MEPCTALRTILLRERRATACRLARQDVDFLLAAHRGHVDLVPTAPRGWYRLTPRGHVGTIVGPTCRLLIRPKLPLENLFHLLDPTSPLPVVMDPSTPVPTADGLDFLAARLAQLLQERAAAGLHRAYQERAERGPFLQGQLDVSAHLHSGQAFKSQLPCRFDEFTVDVPCNQLPKAAAELVLRSGLLSAPVRAKLGQALEAFATVRTIPVDAERFPEIETDRLTEAYRPLLELCRLLVRSLGPSPRSGATACPAFLLDMEEVFERYVTAGVLRAAAGSPSLTVSVQPGFIANQRAPHLPDIQLRPDFLLARAGQPFLVGDVKWKRLPGAPLITTDLYQVLTYCTALDVRRGLLVYPGRRERVWRYALSRAPVRLEIRTLQVVGSREACARSWQRLAKAFPRQRTAR